MNKEQAKEIFRKYLRHIRRSIKSKISLYDPLDFKTAFKAFLEWLQKEEYKVIREFPGGDSNFETYLNELIRQFLVEKTFYLFLFEDQDLVENYVRDILTNYSIPIELSEEIAIFVRKILETREKVASFKRNFKERSKLKTYFYAAIARLVFDYQDKYNIKEEYNVIKKVEPNDTNDIDKLPSNINSPLTVSEVAEVKARVENLPDKEKLVFKLYYYDGITNFNALGRTLRTTRYKAEKLVNIAKDKVLKGEKNDTPGS